MHRDLHSKSLKDAVEVNVFIEIKLSSNGSTTYIFFVIVGLVKKNLNPLAERLFLAVSISPARKGQHDPELKV